MKKQNRGYSLIEVLVAVSIVGLLSAIATVTYVKYKENAVLSAFVTNATNIARATVNCFSGAIQQGELSECDELSEISVRCDSCKTKQGATDPANHRRICYEMELSLGGKRYLGCVSINEEDLSFHQSIRETGGTDNIKFCYKDTPPSDPSNPNNCQTGSFDSCDTLIYPLEKCQSSCSSGFCHQSKGKCKSDGACE